MSAVGERARPLAGRVAAAAARARRPSGWALVVAGILLAVAAVRLAFLLSDAGRLTADETVSALASQDVLRGHLAVFYPGQRYMGTFESSLAAACLAVLPDDALTVRLPQLLLAVLTAWALVATGLRLGATRGQAALTGLLFAVGPAFLIVGGVRTNGAYATMLLVGTLGLWLAVEGAERARPVGWAAALGLLCGFGAWENTQTAYLLAPSALWLAASWRGAAARCAGAFALAFVVGFAPVLSSVARAGLGDGLLGFNDPTAPADQAHATLSTRWDALYGGELPQLLGLRQTPNGAPVAAWFPAGPLVLLAAAALGAALWARRDTVRATLRLRREVGAPRPPSRLAGPDGPATPSGLAGPDGPAAPLGLAGPGGPAAPSGLAGPGGPATPLGLAGPGGPATPLGLAGPGGPATPSRLAGPGGPAAPSGLAARDPLTLPLLALALAPLLYAASARGAYAAEPRYLFGTVLALGRLAPPGRRVAGPLVAAGLVVGTGALALSSLRALPPGTPSPASARAAAHVLEAAGETDAWGYYFTVWPVEFFADGRVRVSALSPQRFPARARAIQAAPHPAYVVQPGVEDGQLQAAFAAHQVRARRTDVGGLVVYTNLDPPLQPGALGL